MWKSLKTSHISAKSATRNNIFIDYFLINASLIARPLISNVNLNHPGFKIHLIQFIDLIFLRKKKRNSENVQRL